MEKELRWDDIEVGEEVGPLEYEISEELIDKFAKAIDDYDDWYMKDSPFGGRIAHPTFSATDYVDLMFLKRTPIMSWVHAKQSIELINPAKLGSKVTVTGKIVDKYIKRGRRYIELVYVAIDQDGQEITRNNYISMAPQ